MFHNRILFSLLLVFALAASACGASSAPTPTPAPAVTWDASPDKVIIRATFCCGFVPQGYAENYIPDALVWGDGRILWSQVGNSGARRVLEGHLTSEQMTALIQRITDAGFFGWKDEYADYSVTDLASQCLSVALTGRSKTVCEYYTGAPEAFHTLYADLAGGVGATGSDFAPITGYLIAYPQNFGGQPAPQAEWNWPANSLEFSLGEAVNGKWVEGEALAFAWRVVNAKVWGSTVQDGDAYYQIVVQIPGVSQNALPAP